MDDLRQIKVLLIVQNITLFLLALSSMINAIEKLL